MTKNIKVFYVDAFTSKTFGGNPAGVIPHAGNLTDMEMHIGKIPVKWMMENNQLKAVSMTQVTPQVNDIDINPKLVAELVGIDESDIDSKYPVKIPKHWGTTSSHTC